VERPVQDRSTIPLAQTGLPVTNSFASPSLFLDLISPSIPYFT